MTAPIPETMLTAAARELCRRHAEVCEVDKDDTWTVYSDDFRSDAKLVLEAIGAGELVAALEAFLRAPSIGSGGPGSSTLVVQDFNLRAARAALAKAGVQP